MSRCSGHTFEMCMDVDELDTAEELNAGELRHAGRIVKNRGGVISLSRKRVALSDCGATLKGIAKSVRFRIKREQTMDSEDSSERPDEDQTIETYGRVPLHASFSDPSYGVCALTCCTIEPKA